MRRYTFYLAVALLAFGIGSFFVFKFYIQANTNKDSSANYINAINEDIKQIEAENIGFDELVKAKDGDVITVQGFIDIKFLCLDVTDSQQNICTTVLIGNSSEKKSLLIRLQVCNDQAKSNCIVWKPNNLCPDNILCSDKIKIYNNNLTPTELAGYFQSEQVIQGKQTLVHYYKNIQLKVTGRVSIIEGKARLLNPIEHIESIEGK